MNVTARTRESDTGIRQIPVAAIKLDPLAQPRAEVDHDLAAEYSEAMAAGETFPPLVVFNDRRTYWLADGFHRHEAAKKAGLREIACVVKSGGLRDAILYSCQANSQHGWRRSNGDKRRAVLTLLADDEWGRWSDREIARHAKVGAPLVAKLRVEAEGAHLKEITDTARTVERGGKTYQMHTSRIGKAATPATRKVEQAGTVTVSSRFAETPGDRKQSEAAARGEELAGEFVKRFGAEDLEIIVCAFTEIIAAEQTWQTFLRAITHRAPALPGYEGVDAAG